MDFLTALEVLAPPPAGVQPLGDDAWARFEAENGFRPPADYRALIDRYGVGGFGYEHLSGVSLYLLHPVGAGYTFVEQSSWQRSVNTGFQRRYPEFEPDWPMWPAPGGFLQWAGVESDQVGWLTAGRPDEWRTAVHGRDDHFLFPFGCVEFIYRWFTGTTGVEEIDALADGELRFYPAGPPDPSAARPPSVEVAVVLLGVGADGERQATGVVDRWMSRVLEDFIIVRSYGRVSESVDDPLHWEIALEIPSPQEALAKEWVVSLAHDLAVGVREVRNLEHDLVWDDVVRRTARF